MIRFRVKMFFDVWVDKTEYAKLFARIEAQKISDKIPTSFIEEVKRLYYGSENILRKENGNRI
ncbi:MAG: hypothetical protein QQN55_08485 [Nitrosopumilus sp.]